MYISTGQTDELMNERMTMVDIKHLVLHGYVYTEENI